MAAWVQGALTEALLRLGHAGLRASCDKHPFGFFFDSRALLIEVRCGLRAIQPPDHLIINPRHPWLLGTLTFFPMGSCGEEWRRTTTSILRISFCCGLMVRWFDHCLVLFRTGYINASPSREFCDFVLGSAVVGIRALLQPTVT